MDLDFEECVATIRQAVTRIPTKDGLKLEIHEVKTDAGNREAPLAPWAVEALRALRVRVAEKRLVAGRRGQDHDLVFSNNSGRPLRERHVNTTRHRTLNTHDLLHSKGTLMIDEGEELVVVQRTLGHASPTITANLYIGKVPKSLRRAADRFGELLDPRREATG